MIESGTELQFNNTTVITDATDAAGNSPRFGFLWLRRLEKLTGTNFQMLVDNCFMDNEVQTSNVKEVVGVINIVTGEMFSKNLYEFDNLVAINNEFELELFYKAMVKKTFVEKVKGLFNG